MEIEKGSYANLALGRRQDYCRLSPQDRALVTELVYGVVRQKKRLEWVLAQYSSRSPGKTDAGVREILLLALYQLTFLSGMPPHAVVHQAVEQARSIGFPGAAGFINGVLRGFLRAEMAIEWPDPAREPVNYLSVYHSHPTWMVRRWHARWGFRRTGRLLSANNASRPPGGRFNTLRGSPQCMARCLRAEGLFLQAGHLFPEAFRLMRKGPSFSPGSVPSFRRGLWTVQDEASLAPVRVLAPGPGERILDACAGPGGKTGHIAQIMEDKGVIVAADVHKHRINLIEDNCRRLGIGSLECILQDTRKRWTPGRGFHRILVDAPCSGTGVLSRRPDARWRRREQDLLRFHRLQREILEGVSGLLEPGGTLVYSTCSLEEEENMDTVRAFLAQKPRFALEDCQRFLPPALSPAFSEEGCVEILPHQWETDGMFVALLVHQGGPTT